MPLSLTIGLEFADDEVRLIETEAIGHIVGVTSADFHPVPDEFSGARLLDLPHDTGIARRFIQMMTDTLCGVPRIPRRIAISLPATVPLIATIPIDRDLEEKEKVRQLEWDSRTLLGIPANAGVSLHSMPLDRNSSIENRLVVALPDSLLHFLKDTFTLLGFHVTSIRIRHFIMEDWLEKRMAVSVPEARGIVGVFDDHAIVGLYHRTSYSGFHLQTISRKQPYTPQIIRLIRDTMATHGMSFLTTVHLYGPHATSEFASILSEALGWPALPTAHHLAATFRRQVDLEAFEDAPHRFESALCALPGGVA